MSIPSASPVSEGAPGGIPDAAEQGRPARHETTTTIRNQSQPHIIMIEDDQNDAGLLLLAMDEVGVRAHVHPVADPGHAFELMRKLSSPPALIILDLNLPKMRGDVLLENIRFFSPWHDVPVVVFSAAYSEQDAETCRKLGVSSITTKPDSYDGYLTFARTLRPYLSTDATSS